MKKCKVIIVPVKSGGIIYKNGYDEWMVCPPHWNNGIAHIEFCDENNNIVATTNKLNKHIPSIPISFIDKFIENNESIKEVLVSGITELYYTDEYNVIPKLKSRKEVIVHLMGSSFVTIKNTISISDIPIKEIRDIIDAFETIVKHFNGSINYKPDKSTYIIKKWLKDNNL